MGLDFAVQQVPRASPFDPPVLALAESKPSPLVYVWTNSFWDLTA